ncbi:hypothetical protein KR200_001031 [Drosophila serrata]|nr:hypothetical protein KR200_001031 [Drosophila serrata]
MDNFSHFGFADLFLEAEETRELGAVSAAEAVAVSKFESESEPGADSGSVSGSGEDAPHSSSIFWLDFQNEGATSPHNAQDSTDRRTSTRSRISVLARHRRRR